MTKIMNNPDPAQQKKIPVKGFHKADWNGVSDEIMRLGLTMKFDQNRDLKEFLCKTGSKILCEASPYDKHWGIGMRQNNPNILDKTKWGKNLLGTTLMRVREDLK